MAPISIRASVCIGTVAGLAPAEGRAKSANESWEAWAWGLVRDDDWHLQANWRKLGVSTRVCDERKHQNRTTCAAVPCLMFCSPEACCRLLFIHHGACYSCYSAHIAPLGALLPRIHPCPSSYPLHLLPWWLMLATARPSGAGSLAGSSPRLMEDASAQINRADLQTLASLHGSLGPGFRAKWVLIEIMYSDNLWGSCSITGVAASNTRGVRKRATEK